MDSVLTCGAGKAGEPGSIPVLSKWFFLSGVRWQDKNGSRHDNSMLLGIQIVKIYAAARALFLDFMWRLYAREYWG